MKDIKFKITQRNRFLVVIAAVFMELALGALYAWSTFAKILKDPPTNWTSGQTQWVFSAGTLALAIAVIFAGRLNEKFGPQKLILTSAIVTGLGYILGGIFPLEWYWTTLTVGLIGGAGIGIAYAKMGKRVDALKVLSDLIKLANDKYFSAYRIAALYLVINERDQGFKWMERAIEEKDHRLIYLNVDPLLDDIRSDPRFKDVLKKINLE